MNFCWLDLSGKWIIVVGGGQSGVDLFFNVLCGEWGEVVEINWVLWCNNFNVLDEVVFVDEYFIFEYILGFFGLKEDICYQLLDEQKMILDGIIVDFLLIIYCELYYCFEVLRKLRNICLLFSCLVIILESSGLGWRLLMEYYLDQGRESLESDVVIFVIGYCFVLL